MKYSLQKILEFIWDLTFLKKESKTHPSKRAKVVVLESSSTNNLKTKSY
ncbi:hypothetical protein [Sulfurimonas sp.]|nr:hypothetical protein [Sulfurimonas sp.]MDD3855410.1 hypothetical protein [Sulfurimonas sp.]